METNRKTPVHVILFVKEREDGDPICQQCDATERRLKKFAIPYKKRTIAKNDRDTIAHIGGSGDDALGEFVPMMPLVIIVRAEDGYDPGFRPLNPERVRPAHEQYDPKHVVEQWWAGFHPDKVKAVSEQYTVSDASAPDRELASVS